MLLKKSFTLIELLVVIAILGILSALFLPNFMAAREKARDTQRKSDLKQIQKAMEMYRQDQNPPSYPNELPIIGSCWSSGPDCSGNIYMNKFPTDPLPNKQYYYQVNNDNLTYNICACLENTADPDGSEECSSCENSCQKCYIVNQP